MTQHFDYLEYNASHLHVHCHNFHCTNSSERIHKYHFQNSCIKMQPIQHTIDTFTVNYWVSKQVMLNNTIIFFVLLLTHETVRKTKLTFPGFFFFFWKFPPPLETFKNTIHQPRYVHFGKNSVLCLEYGPQPMASNILKFLVTVSPMPSDWPVNNIIYVVPLLHCLNKITELSK